MSASLDHSVTRGYGLFENLLARLRARQANRLIPKHLRDGRILDIGCGSYPYFLAHTYFREKFAIDQMSPTVEHPEVQWFSLDVNREPHLPFEDHFFSVVTMLAVVEHLNPTSLTSLFREIYRTLIPGGVVLITTPASWADGLLHLLARLHLVSAAEINEHVYAYTLPLLGWYYGQAGFAMQKVRFGYFECFLNMWGVAEK